MRRFAIATLAGLALLTGQAAAANQGPDLRVGDRVGPTKGVSKKFTFTPAMRADMRLALQDPWILGGIVAAAIAIPIALHQQKDSSP